MKQAVILAAGEGKRLRPFTVTKPKAMLSIAGKPVLQYVIEALAQNGIRRIVIVAGYRRDQIFDYIGSGERFGIDLLYVNQEKQLGTAHALLQAREAVDGEFLVLPGDKLIEADTIRQFVSAKPDSVLVKKVANPSRYGVAIIENGLLKCIEENPGEPVTSTVSTGIYAFSRDIFNSIAPVLDIPDAINNMIADGHSVKALETGGTWLDVVYPWDIIGLNEAVLRQVTANLGGTIEAGASVRGQVEIGKGTVIRSNSYIIGPVVIGENCDIGPNVCILAATSIGNNVVVKAFTEIENSVIGDDVHIGPGSVVQESVIDKGCDIKGHFTACSDQDEIRVNGEHHMVSVGAMLGESCKLDNSVVAQPGVIVGNYCQIHALKLISGRLPDKSLVL